MDLSQLQAEIRRSNDALSDAIGFNTPGADLLTRLADELEGMSATTCAYCTRPGTVGRNCDGCGAYVAAPKILKRAPVAPTVDRESPDDYASDLPDAFVQIIMLVSLAVICFVLYQMVLR